jgi:hypothetical protein
VTRRLSPLLSIAAALVLVVASSGIGMTLASFSDTTNSLGNAFTAAASFCASTGTQTVTSDADTWVDEYQPTTNRGTQTSLEIQSRNGRNRRVLVHFALPAAPFCTVSSATLRLNSTNADLGRTLQAYRVVGAWTESGVTWNTQPAAAGSPATAASSAGWVPFDVTVSVQTMYAGGNDGFLVKDSVESQNPATNQAYDSRESSGGPPELVITFA